MDRTCWRVAVRRRRRGVRRCSPTERRCEGSHLPLAGPAPDGGSRASGDGGGGRLRPGGSSSPHRHPCAVLGYVVEGALRSATDSGPETTYRAGESFYEAPNAVHRVSANASDREPVRFTASFICDHDTPLSVPAPEADTGRGREP